MAHSCAGFGGAAHHALGPAGLLAWWFWLAAHVFFLIGFRNRVSVLLNWALAYWTYQRSARIVLGETRSGGGPKP